MSTINNPGSGIDNTAWATYTPTLAADAGTFTGETISKSGTYKQIGKTVLWNARITITNMGSGSPVGNLKVSLPIAPASSAAGYGRESAVTGAGVGVFFATGDAAYAAKSSDGSSVIVNGYDLYLGGIYQVA